jgi:DNA-binding PadR family transcriptional regulator
MTQTSTESHQSKLLNLFAKANDRLKAGDLKKKLAGKAKEIPEPEEVDRAFTDLIEQGLITVTGGSKQGHHPRTSGSYRLTEKGRQHLRPAKPDVSPELLQIQEAFILLQVFRAKDQRLTRTELIKKLSTKIARGELEFDPESQPGSIDYHLTILTEKNCLEEKKSPRSVAYTFLSEKGQVELARATQYPSLSFTLTGERLNELLKAAQGSVPDQIEESLPDIEKSQSAAPAPRSSSLSPDDIIQYIEQLRADKYAAKGLVPIHEVRRIVAERHGMHDAGHPTFDSLLMQMRSEGQLELIAISDNRNATQEQLDASIPGMNSTIFYIVLA